MCEEKEGERRRTMGNVGVRRKGKGEEEGACVRRKR